MDVVTGKLKQYPTNNFLYFKNYFIINSYFSLCGPICLTLEPWVFLIAVWDLVPFLAEGACSFRWVLHLGAYRNGSAWEMKEDSVLEADCSLLTKLTEVKVTVSCCFLSD